MAEPFLVSHHFEWSVDDTGEPVTLPCRVTRMHAEGEVLHIETDGGNYVLTESRRLIPCVGSGTA